MYIIQIVFYWVATIALGLIAVFILVAIAMLFYIKSQVSKITRATERTMLETRLAMEAAKSRFQGLGAGIMSAVWAMLLRILKESN